MEQQLNQKIIELQKENEKINEENAELKEKNIKLEEKLAKIETYMKKKKLSIPHRILPAELFDELFASMPLENSFGLLAKMPNGLLARNVQRMINSIKEAMKNNKWNEADCGSKLEISVDDGLTAKHSGSDGDNCVRAILPIPTFNLKGIDKSLIVSYFEIENLNGDATITIGFCETQFPLEDQDLEWMDNTSSIGIVHNRRIRNDGSQDEFKNTNEFFKKGNFIGIGIIHQPNSKMEYFATCNGKFLGKAEMPPKFADLQLFPAITLANAGALIRLNFGKDKWHYKKFGLVLE